MTDYLLQCLRDKILKNLKDNLEILNEKDNQYELSEQEQELICHSLVNDPCLDAMIDQILAEKLYKHFDI